ncbi:MAG: O-antigen ligase family protein [Bacilli bacterium]|nr:O-antigen ligase family protein [Bacilli bacterium]
MQKIKKEDFIYLFILLSPILDVFSSIINFGSFSPSLFIRPIIPLILLIYIFIKDKKTRKYLITAGFIYILFAIVHLLLYRDLITGISYGGIIYEASYLCNYTYLIFTLFLFLYLFKDKDKNKLNRTFVIYTTIYIISIYLSIITNTAGSTYVEGAGYKGWFNTGGAVGSIFISSLFILIPYLFNNKKHFTLKVLLIASIIFYLCFLLGTRVGLLGGIIVLFCYIAFQIFCSITKTNKIVFKNILTSCALLIVTILGLFAIGSESINRRQDLADLAGKVPDVEENTVVDLDETIYMAYDLVKLKVQIENNIISEEYMSKEQQRALLELDKYSSKNKLASTDVRKQQLLYHRFLYQEQNNIFLKLFGNGYLTNAGNLTLEMEIIALFYNFGIIGFVIFIGPFFLIFGYGLYKGVKNIRQINVSYLMLLAGCFMTYMISFLAGHTYFNSSVMIVIVLLHTLLLEKAFLLKKEK